MSLKKWRHRTIQDMHALARQRNGKCLSTRYTNLNTKLTWQCERGHVWTALPNNIQMGSWCPRCAFTKYTISDMKKLAAKNGGRCLSADYINSKTSLRWSCSQGHEWEAAPESIKNGSWCPRCGGRYRSSDDLKQLARTHGGWCLTPAYKGARVKLRWRCRQGHEWDALPWNVRRGSWCLTCSATEYRIKDMLQHAKKHKGKCISTVYKNNFTPMKWQCAKGHVWEARWNAIRKGGWCPFCKGRYRTIKEMKEIAARRGGTCLSERYVSRGSRLRWQCERKHIWMAPPYYITRGHWCPQCYKDGRK